MRDTQNEMATEEEIESWETDADAAYAEAERLIMEAEYRNLTELDFFSVNPLRALENLPPIIEKLTELTHLDLFDTKVSDIGVVAAFHGLEHLDISGTKVTDISAVAHLKKLKRFFISRTPVSSIAAISGLDNLTTLKMYHSDVDDLAPLGKLKSLSIASSRDRSLGLEYHAIPASENDPTLGKLAKLDNPERTIETLQYLNGLHPQYGGLPSQRSETEKSENIGHNNRLPLIEEELERPLASISLADFGFDELGRVIRMVPFHEESLSTQHPTCHAMIEELAMMAKDLHTDVKNTNTPPTLSRALSRYAAEASKELTDLLPGRLWDIAETFRDATYDDDVLASMPPLADKQLERLLDKHLDLMRAVMAPTLARMGQLENLKPAPDADPRIVEQALDVGAAVIEEHGEEFDQYISAALRDMGAEINSMMNEIDFIADSAMKERLTSRVWKRTKVAGGTLYRLALKGIQILNVSAALKTLAPGLFDAAIKLLKEVFTDIDWPS